ncbi:MAG: Lrp/AsnC family transcriptional regulator [Candidatus Heimdallarchaeota archaeon]
MLDDKDKIILRLLEKNARLTTAEIHDKTKIPRTTVHNRIKKMYNKGVIEKFTVKINKKKIGKGLSAFIFCTVSYRSTKGHSIDQLEVARSIKGLPEVEEVSIVTGEIDLIVKVTMADVEALNSFVIEQLRNVTGIERTVTSVVLSSA